MHICSACRCWPDVWWAEMREQWAEPTTHSLSTGCMWFYLENKTFAVIHSFAISQTDVSAVESECLLGSCMIASRRGSARFKGGDASSRDVATRTVRCGERGQRGWEVFICESFHHFSLFFTEDRRFTRARPPAAVGRWRWFTGTETSWLPGLSPQQSVKLSVTGSLSCFACWGYWNETEGGGHFWSVVSQLSCDKFTADCTLFIDWKRKC